MSRPLGENLAALYSVHFLNQGLPLLTLPYLARVLGPTEWGALAFAEAYGGWLAMVVEYGFGLSATREAARFGQDDSARARLLTAVLGAQFILSGLAAALTIVLVAFVAVFSSRKSLVLWALAFAVTRSLPPFWYFQGLERMRTAASLNIAMSVAATAGVFFLVRAPGDGWMSLSLRALACLISTALLFAIAWWETPFIWPSFDSVWSALRKGGTLLWFNSSASLYTTANMFLLGLVAPPAVVAWYAGAEKIARATARCTGPIAQAFYPRISNLAVKDHSGALRAVRLSSWLMMTAGILAGLFLFATAPLVVRLLLGSAFEPSVQVLRIMALLPPLVAGSNVLGIQWMLPLGLDREFNFIILGAGLVNIALASVLARPFRHIGMALTVVTTELFVTAALFFVLRRRRLDPFRDSSSGPGRLAA